MVGVRFEQASVLLFASGAAVIVVRCVRQKYRYLGLNLEGLFYLEEPFGDTARRPFPFFMSISKLAGSDYFAFLIDPMKLGPVSDPSLWIMKSTFSPFGVQSSRTLSPLTL